MRMQSQPKKPACAMPSTMTIMPAMKVMVAQLMPELASSAPAEYQNDGVTKSASDSEFQMASGLLMQTPNTKTSVSRPHESVTMWRSILSMTMSTNMTRKMTSAMICSMANNAKPIRTTRTLHWHSSEAGRIVGWVTQ